MRANVEMRIVIAVLLSLAVAFVAVVSVYGSRGLNSWALYQAIEDGDEQRVRDLARSGVNVEVQYLRGLTPLLLALDRDEREVYEALLEEGADPNKLVLNGVSVMHLAAFRKDSWWLQKAIDHGGDVNLVNVGNGFVPNSTPLFYAINGQSLESLNALIKAKADLDWENAQGDTPPVAACEHSRYDFVLMLLEAGADYHKKNVVNSSLVDEIKLRPDGFGPDDEQREFLSKVKQWLRDRKAL